MVPNLVKGAGIKGAALYVLHDKRTEEDRAIGAELTPEYQTRSRVGMTATRNLSTDDPELAWRLMCATAASRDALKEAAGIRTCGRQTKNFCGHLSLSWELQTQPDAAEIQRAADGALKALGWEKLQALIVEHRDEDHAHCHIVVNLIDPETGRTAPNAKNDYDKLQRWAHEYDKDRGIEVCPDRAKRMERLPEDPTPPKPSKRWLTRQEFEAIRTTERAEHRAQAMGRYREAAAEVREQFRPAWAAHYKTARGELRTFDRDATRRFTELANANHPDHILDFYKKHQELIWRGVRDDQRPGNNHTLLTKGFMQGAIERAQENDRALLLMQHERSKTLLQDRHTEARQEAYRAAWKPPVPAEVVPITPQTDSHATDRKSGKVGLAAVLAVSAAGIAAYAFNRQQQGKERQPDPVQDLAAAAERIARQRTRAANANVEPSRRAEIEAPPKAGVDRSEEAKPARSDGGAVGKAGGDAEAAMRRQIMKDEAAIRARFKAAQGRERGLDRERRRD